MHWESSTKEIHRKQFVDQASYYICTADYDSSYKINILVVEFAAFKCN